MSDDRAEEWRAMIPSDSVAAAQSQFSDEELDSPADRVYSILEAARGIERATVKLFRVTGPNRYGWCQDYAIEEFEAGGFNAIREVWGPGEYEIRLYSVRSDGQYGVRAKPRIVIEADPRAVKSAAPPPAPPAPSADPAMRELLASIAQTQARMLEALTQRPDPTAQLQTMIGLAGAMRQAFGGGEAPRSSITEVVQAVRELRAVSDEINPKPAADAADPDNPMSLLPGVLDLVGKLAGQQQQSAPAPSPQLQLDFPPVTLPAGIAAAAPSTSGDPVSLPVTQQSGAADAPTDSEMNALQFALLRGYLARIDAMRVTGDVAGAAEYLIGKLPDEGFEILHLPNWLELLTQFYPAAANPLSREWFTRVREKALELLKEDE